MTAPRKPITTEERRALRRKPFWRVADFARYMSMSHEAARRLLVRYDTELHGMLLRRSRGTNRCFGFYWAALAKHDSDAFVDDPLETQKRVDELEDEVTDIGQQMRGIGLQGLENKRRIAALETKRRPAA